MSTSRESEPGKPTALSLRFSDPRKRAAIAAAARAAGVSMQDYILSAAYERATAVEAKFLAAFDAAVARTSEAFAAEAGGFDPSAEQRAAERQAEDRAGRNHAA
ncbi:DUF1778 domain-containing protein [Streptomyces sp. NBC_01190]|uniref:type II toxin -antitoxin system TacA 1-like antitoxin n=1 Tax=Streptomyces sp. NBC_01190 TaxID=2903767 RepID=UPI003867F65F|nr:DUF1778 domain-containing protein [Streptomyces sp. NBC_01190]